jgi:hypothetical protein
VRPRVGVVVVIVCGALLVAGVVVYGGGHHRLGGAILAVALIGVGIVIAPALSAEGRGAEAVGVMGRRADVTGFDRPRDQSGV